MELGHLEVVDSSAVREVTYFMPHHLVLSPDSEMIKLRVVY